MINVVVLLLSVFSCSCSKIKIKQYGGLRSLLKIAKTSGSFIIINCYVYSAITSQRIVIQPFISAFLIRYALTGGRGRFC